MSKHVLVIGGTGMLSGIVEYFVEKGDTVSVIARNEERLAKLKNSLQHFSGKVNPLAANYKDTAHLSDILLQAINENGPFAYSVNWIHSDAPAAPYVVASILNETSEGCRYVQILGSGAADPDGGLDERILFGSDFPALSYSEVVLGFKVENERARWLTNQEIQAGILDAIRSVQTRHIVGTVRPWEARP